MEKIGDWYICTSLDDVKEVEVKAEVRDIDGTEGDNRPSEYPFLLQINYKYQTYNGQDVWQYSIVSIDEAWKLLFADARMKVQGRK